jgi:uncharacterized membrane protein
MTSDTPTRIIRWIALLGGTLTATQAGINWITGEGVCPNAGCRVVERLTTVPPLMLNLVGLAFFLLIFLIARPSRNRDRRDGGLLGLVLVSGLAFEAVLFAYQVFVAGALCSYCLTILALVVAMNLLCGVRQGVVAGAVSAAVVLPFSVLIFMPVGAGGQPTSLKTAAYARKSCSSPTKEIYLIFSADCPHCQNVIDTLSECNSCDLYLNPIGAAVDLSLDGLEPNSGFSPEINRFVLNALGIDSVPVLLAREADGYRVIKGEKRIVTYVRGACFTQNPVLYYDRTSHMPDQEISVFTEDGGECSVAIDCP